MARTPTTPEQRIGKVRSAADSLPALLAAALASPADPARWAAVEDAGATIHRQARILAGKPRGG